MGVLDVSLLHGLETGEKFGWGRVLDYIGVEWEDYPAVQMSLFDMMEDKAE